MSDSPGGADWWQASDGKWYPPHTHPDYRPPQPATPPPYQPPYPPTPAPPQTPYAPPGYQQPAYQPAYSSYDPYSAPPQTSSKATAVLVLSILSFVICPFVLAVIALGMAPSAAREIRESGGRQTGEGLVTAGRIISIINIIGCVLVVGFIALVATVFDEGVEEFGVGFQDSFVQSELEDALSVEQEYFANNGRFTDDPIALEGYDEFLDFTQGNRPFATDVIVVQASERDVTLGSRSGSGTCYYIRHSTELTTYAEDAACGDFSSQVFTGSW